jgi:hypothetical protein
LCVTKRATKVTVTLAENGVRGQVYLFGRNL